jgi:DHA3 family macrolide efflux protein-like MFS transporter
MLDTSALGPSALRSEADGPGAGWQIRYWSIFGGQASSLVGSALTQFVLLWWITDTTGSVSALALAGVFALLPQALFGPLGGTFADRYSRRFLMIATDAVSALCMIVLIALFVTERVELWHAYAMMFARSAMQAFQQPAAAASTAMLVPRDFLTRAAGLNQMLGGIMLVGAAPLGALALVFIPIGYALAIDVATALLGIVSLLIFKVPQERVAPKDRRGVWREFRQGFDTVWLHPGLRRLYGLVAATTLVVMPSMTLVPLLAKEHFQGGAPEVALLEGLAGAGMIVGGVVATALRPRRKIVWVIFSFAASSFALALTGLAPASMLWLGAAFWSLSGLLYILGSAPMTALLQTIVPNPRQGRAFSLLSTALAAAGPIGLMLAMPLGEAIGIQWLFVVMGMLSGIVALLGFLSKPLMDIENGR